MKLPISLVLLLLAGLSVHAQRVDILRPDGTVYRTIHRHNQVNLTYQQTPFLQVNYSARVADVTNDTLFLIDRRLGLVGLAVDKITGLQRVRSGVNLGVGAGVAVVLGVVGGKLLRPIGSTNQTGEAFFTRLVATSVVVTGAALITRLIAPRKPRKRLDRGYTFRAVGAYP